MLACADIEEGVVLRRAGVRVPILVFGALSVSDLDGLFEFALTPTISTPSAARAVQAAAARHKTAVGYHLKIDTGHEPARLPPRQPAAHAAGAAGAARTCGSRRSTRISRPRTSRRVRSSISSATNFEAAVQDDRRVARGGPRVDPRQAACSSRCNSAATAARLARLVRHGSPGPAALRHRAAAARLHDSAHAGHVADQPRRRGERRCDPAKASATALRFQADAPRDRGCHSRRLR